MATFLLAKVTFETTFKKMGIDVSGHAIEQAGSAIYALNYLTALDAANISSPVYKVVVATVSFNDFLWAYNTLANYHSVADVASALACTVGIDYILKIVFLKTLGLLLRSGSHFSRFYLPRYPL